MKKMFNLAVAVVAMSSALSLTSCHKFFGNSAGDQKSDDATIVEDAPGNDSLDNDTTGAAAATDAAKTPAADAAKAPATDADKK